MIYIANAYTQIVNQMLQSRCFSYIRRSISSKHSCPCLEKKWFFKPFVLIHSLFYFILMNHVVSLVFLFRTSKILFLPFNRTPSSRLTVVFSSSALSPKFNRKTAHFSFSQPARRSASVCFLPPSIRQTGTAVRLRRYLIRRAAFNSYTFCDKILQHETCETGFPHKDTPNWRLKIDRKSTWRDDNRQTAIAL